MNSVDGLVLPSGWPDNNPLNDYEKLKQLSENFLNFGTFPRGFKTIIFQSYKSICLINIFNKGERAKYDIYTFKRAIYTLKHILRLNKNNVDEKLLVPRRVFVVSWFGVYLSTKIATLAWTSYEYARLMEKWWPEVRQGGPRYGDCALPEDIFEPDKKIGNEVRYNFKWLYYLGYFTVDQADYVAFFWSNVTFIFFILYSSIFIDLKENYLNALSFILDPFNERARIDKLLRKIIDAHYSFSFYNGAKHSDSKGSSKYKKKEI